MNPLAQAIQKKLIITVDFGTSYTGFAWAFPSDSTNTIYNRDDWDDAPCRYSKTPTAILYRKKKPVYIGWQAIKDAMESDENEDILLEGFKMDLLGSGIIIKNDVQFLVDDVITDYLKIFRQKYIMGWLKDKLGSSLDFKISDVHWVFSVPAIWPEKERSRMRTIAFKAGYTEKEQVGEKHLMIVSEPEAAAAHCINELKKKNLTLVPNDMYILLDAGGGTVDLTSHIVDNDGKLRELTIQTGAPIGSRVLDDNFLVLIKEKLGSTVMDYITKNQNVKLQLMSHWEKAKTTICDNTQKRFPVPAQLALFLEKQTLPLVATDKFYVVTTTRITLTEESINQIFHENMNKICKLVQDQLDKIEEDHGRNPKYLFLVGGLAQSPLLKNLIESKYGNLVKIISSSFAGESVENGGTHLALDPSLIRTRKSKFTYGIEVDELFQPDLHNDEDCVCEGDKFLVKGVFKIFAQIGETISVEEKKEEIFFVPTGAKQIKVELLKSILPHPKKANSDKVVRLCKILVDVDECSQNSNVSIKMQFGKAEIIVSAEGPNGKVYDTTTTFETELLT